ncbi:bicaudal-D-related protein 2-like isoform X3 [Phyllopteryx taeniolatus]|uniref:bicaudal-D-related protein 2-like isoform X3 n=1 Tax=Phyllopteryx taeniolatus TaxID=161469 RepID=UPI002AD2FDAE|nr:bicaudal-D-related protein 2-like isoform X3 [Phyllopteryx taeniolatus]
MDYTSRDPDVSADFSDLNSRLRPRLSSSEQLYCSLSRVQSRPARQRSTSRRTASLSEPEDDGPDASVGPGAEADSRVLAGMSLTDAREGADSDSGPRSTSQQGRSESPTSEGGESPFQRSYMSLPDLINGGRPLGRRRTLGHVNDTLNEVRREVELSRRRSIKLKAQVDKLQESRHGPGWSRDRERVTEEIFSILRLMQLMPEHQGGRRPDPPPPGANCLDAALAQLQDIARKMAVSGIGKKEEGDGDGAPAQQVGDDAAQQPAAGGGAETLGALSGAGGLEGGHAASAPAAAAAAAAGGAGPEENVPHGHLEEEQGACTAPRQLPGGARPRLTHLAHAQSHPDLLRPSSDIARPGGAHLEGQVEEGQRGAALAAGGAPARGRRRLPGGLARLTSDLRAPHASTQRVDHYVYRQMYTI